MILFFFFFFSTISICVYLLIEFNGLTFSESMMAVVFIVVINDDVDDCNDGEKMYMVVMMMVTMTKIQESESEREIYCATFA